MTASQDSEGLFEPDAEMLKIWERVPGRNDDSWSSAALDDEYLLDVLMHRARRLIRQRQGGFPPIIITQEKVLITRAVAALLDGDPAENYVPGG